MKKLGLFYISLFQLACTGQIAERINGISFVASREKVEQENVDEVLRLKANHAAVMPFGFTRDIHSPEVIFDTGRQWYGETSEGAEQYLRLLKKNGIRVMLKPQIWIWRGEFTGTLKMKTEEDWKTFEASYSQFILSYARLAQKTKVAILCIGTELEQFVVNRPDYWRKLIKEIRGLYSGKLTYAANWDEYTRTPFWEQLDYIGVDAYFPLSEERDPSAEQLEKGWQKWKGHMEELSKKVGKPVLFTEFGYRSMDYTAKKPWLVDRNQENVNLQAQARATQVIFDEFWKEDWFAGGYIWKWFIDHEKSGGSKNNRFTPQNKPAEETIRAFYKLYMP
ncbi:MAG: glycoside hydrolase TIM-barrel-like domain-containing protein [Bacteroidota bacterium]